MKFLSLLSALNFQLSTTTEFSMSSKTLNLLIFSAGGLLILVSLLADVIGIGSYPGINWAQIVGAAVGLVLLIIGIIRPRLKTKE